MFVQRGVARGYHAHHTPSRGGSAAAMTLTASVVLPFVVSAWTSAPPSAADSASGMATSLTRARSMSHMTDGAAALEDCVVGGLGHGRFLVDHGDAALDHHHRVPFTCVIAPFTCAIAVPSTLVMTPFISACTVASTSRSSL